MDRETITIRLPAELKERMQQEADMQDTVQFVDSVRNTGVLTDAMFERYQNQIRRRQSGLEVYMVHTTDSMHLGETGIEQTAVIRTEDEIQESLTDSGEYRFKKGDYFRVEVKKKISDYQTVLYGNPVNGIESARTVYVYYGGSVRYED